MLSAIAAEKEVFVVRLQCWGALVPDRVQDKRLIAVTMHCGGMVCCSEIFRSSPSLDTRSEQIQPQVVSMLGPPPHSAFFSAKSEG